MDLLPLPPAPRPRPYPRLRRRRGASRPRARSGDQRCSVVTTPIARWRKRGGQRTPKSKKRVSRSIRYTGARPFSKVSGQGQSNSPSRSGKSFAQMIPFVAESSRSMTAARTASTQAVAVAMASDPSQKNEHLIHIAPLSIFPKHEQVTVLERGQNLKAIDHGLCLGTRLDLHLLLSEPSSLDSDLQPP